MSFTWFVPKIEKLVLQSSYMLTIKIYTWPIRLYATIGLLAHKGKKKKKLIQAFLQTFTQNFCKKNIQAKRNSSPLDIIPIWQKQWYTDYPIKNLKSSRCKKKWTQYLQNHLQKYICVRMKAHGENMGTTQILGKFEFDDTHPS